MADQRPRVNPRTLHDGSFKNRSLVDSILAQSIDIHEPVYLLFRGTPIVVWKSNNWVVAGSQNSWVS